ncbi:MAG: hypothetical protein CL928_15040 [Deltaproteobacteria bacterium]|nr:hypothetical protein [Deltaproteobacteria bacterium]
MPRTAVLPAIVIVLSVALALPLGGAWAQGTVQPSVHPDLVLDTAVDGLQSPSAAAFLPDGSLVILELGGAILVWNGSDRPRRIGSVSVEMDGERGLLGLAVDPQFESSRRLYLFYSAEGTQHVGHVALTESGIGPMTVLVGGMSAHRDHNGGGLAFGPDGHLYFGVGDSGCSHSNSPGNADNYLATCLGRLEGTIGRIDRDGGIPRDNPLVGVDRVASCGTTRKCDETGTAGVPDASVPTAPRPEIWNWGLRNPWRFTFDESTGHLWIGDVGEVTWEEVTIATGPGQHHGWPFREGGRGQSNYACRPHVPGGEQNSTGDCREPAFVYSHFEPPADGQGAIVGGVFSNHCSWPEAYAGRYWFADYNKSRIWTVTPNEARDGVVGDRTLIVEQAGGPVHFLEGPDGALYFVSHLEGRIGRIRPRNPRACDSTSKALGQARSPGQAQSGCGCGIDGDHLCSAGPSAMSWSGLLALALVLLGLQRRKLGGGT